MKKFFVTVAMGICITGGILFGASPAQASTPDIVTVAMSVPVNHENFLGRVVRVVIQNICPSCGKPVGNGGHCGCS